MDYMIRGNLKDKNIRFFVISAKNTVEEMRKIHHTTPTATACAGRSLLATCLIGYTMKNEQDLVTTILDCSGEIRKVTVTSNNKGQVKCDVLNPDLNIYINEKGKLDVKKIVGNGTLKVIKDIGLRDAYVGQVDIVSGEIAEDYTYYFAKSEQTPSVVSLGVLVDEKDYNVIQAGGLIIQLLPGASEEDIIYLENKIKTLEYMTTLLQGGKSIEDIINYIFDDAQVEITHKQEVKYTCNCSKEKIEKVVISLGKKELKQIIEEDKGINLKCHFCGKEYYLNEEELNSLIEGM